MCKSWLVSLVFAVFLGLSGTVGETTLSLGHLPYHQHTQTTEGAGWDYGNASQKAWNTGNSTHTGSNGVLPAGSSGAHTHTLETTTSGGASVLPPYYALAYIMRTA